jgi:hypothetical protein
MLCSSTKHNDLAYNKTVLLKAKLDYTGMNLLQIFHTRAVLQKGYDSFFL